MKWIDSPQINVPFFEFENIKNTNLAVNAFTARPYRKDGRELNFFQPLLRKDSDPEEVNNCISMMVRQFGTDTEHLVTSAQKHTTNIHLVTDEDLKPVSERPVLQFIDGLITNKRGVMLQTFGADCPTVYLLDPVHKAIGLCHSGRKGTQNRIAAVMAEAMSREFSSRPEDLIAAISPGICLDCYEVGEDVAEDFVNDYYNKASTASLRSPADSLKFINGKYHIDLFDSIRQALIDIGLAPSNIEVSHLCTKCRCDILYSFRGEGHISSENSALFMLK